MIPSVLKLKSYLYPERFIVMVDELGLLCLCNSNILPSVHFYGFFLKLTPNRSSTQDSSEVFFRYIQSSVTVCTLVSSNEPVISCYISADGQLGKGPDFQNDKTLLVIIYLLYKFCILTHNVQQ